jgi:hypothetical protein
MSGGVAAEASHELDQPSVINADQIISVELRHALMVTARWSAEYKQASL